MHPASNKIKEEKYILSIDLGTSSSRVAIVNQELQIISIEKMEHDQIHEMPGWTEHDPMQLFFNVNILLDRIYHHQKAVKKINIINIKKN